MPVSMEVERQDGADAWQRASAYRAELNEIYRYYLPFQQSTSQRAPDGGGASEGQSRTDHLFDASGVVGAFNFAGQFVADWLPPFQDFFKLEAGALVPDDQRSDLNRGLDKVTTLAHALLRPRIQLTAHEMGASMFCGTAAMTMYGAGNRKTSDGQTLRMQSVPINELALENGPFGNVEGHWWKKRYKARHLPRLWPNGKFDTTLNELIKQQKAEADIWQSVRWDADEGNWLMRVYAEGGTADHVIAEERTATCPMITPRFFLVPGEDMGRGLGHLGLAFVRSANKARELALRAAAFALMGIWMRRNDGVFNPDTAVFQPLAMWTVASTGGPLGPSLQRLPVPQDFDVTSIVMKDERDQINKILLNDDLPELQDSVRSPTEIAARLRKVSKSKGGAGARISVELVGAIVRRAVDILETQGMLPTKIRIDDFATKVTITSPAAAAQRADKVQWATDWMQIIVGTLGPQALPSLAKVDELIPDIGRWLGNEEKYMPTEADKKEFKELVATIVAKMQVEQQQAKAPPPQPGSQYVNGSAF